MPYDLIVVATLDSSGQQWASLIKDGVPAAKLFPLRQKPGVRRVAAPAASAALRGGAGADTPPKRS